jgi:hypothetical protein
MVSQFTKKLYKKAKYKLMAVLPICTTTIINFNLLFNILKSILLVVKMKKINN